MHSINRRDFISNLSGSLAALAFPLRKALPHSATGGCWLSVSIPLVVEDAASNLHTDIILTSASFQGVDGYRDPAHSTDYELYLYDSSGNAQPIDGAKKVLKVAVPAMRTTLIKCSDLIGRREHFWGGMRIRLWAKGRQATHAGDLFSAAFVRWNFTNSFDTLHAHPDPLQFQTTDKFYSSMPFPQLEEYGCTLSLFNPYEATSSGRIVIYGGDGRASIEQPYKLGPYGAALFNINSGALSSDLQTIFTAAGSSRKEMARGGSILIENDEKRVKNFAYLMIKGKAGNQFAAEHTIHQTNYSVGRGSSPFGPDGKFKARGWVYSTLIFNKKTIGGLNLSSRVYLSAGRPIEDQIWLLAYATDAEGNIQWATNHDPELGLWLPESILSQGAIRFRPFQSCELDFEKVSLKPDFSGGIGIATSIPTSHVLIKAEVRAHNWGTSAFTHFRPGAKSALALEAVKGRDGLKSDYIVSGVRLKRTARGPEADSVIGLLNMDQEKAGSPAIEVFGSDGFLARKSLGGLPGWACKHFLLSDLFPEMFSKGAGPLTLRLMDTGAPTVMSALHIDYARRDIAIDHGSDRLSTYLDYGCR